MLRPALQAHKYLLQVRTNEGGFHELNVATLPATALFESRVAKA